jgi:hypothetical protein
MNDRELIDAQSKKLLPASPRRSQRATRVEHAGATAPLPPRGPRPRRCQSPLAVACEVMMKVAAGFSLSSLSIFLWAHGGDGNKLATTAVATLSMLEMVDPALRRVDPAAPLPDLRWWASSLCGTRWLPFMVAVGCSSPALGNCWAAHGGVHALRLSCGWRTSGCHAGAARRPAAQLRCGVILLYAQCWN